MLIPRSGLFAIAPVAHLPMPLIKIAAPAVPIITHAEVSVTWPLAFVAIAEATMPPVVVSAAASPISVLPLFTSNPVRAVVTLSPLFFAEGL